MCTCILSWKRCTYFSLHVNRFLHVGFFMISNVGIHMTTNVRLCVTTNVAVIWLRMSQIWLRMSQSYDYACRRYMTTNVAVIWLRMSQETTTNVKPKFDWISIPRVHLKCWTVPKNHPATHNCKSKMLICFVFSPSQSALNPFPFCLFSQN